VLREALRQWNYFTYYDNPTDDETLPFWCEIRVDMPLDRFYHIACNVLKQFRKEHCVYPWYPERPEHIEWEEDDYEEKEDDDDENTDVIDMEYDPTVCTKQKDCTCKWQFVVDTHIFPPFEEEDVKRWLFNRRVQATTKPLAPSEMRAATWWTQCYC
jgi:hypothetical protein